MDVTPPLAPSEPNLASRSLSSDVDRYLSLVGKEHRRFLSALSDANRDLSSPGQLTKVASIQTRLTQEFLDAQRAILKRRAETDADIAEIGEGADAEAAAVMSAARSRARISLGRPLPPPVTGSWAAPLLGPPTPRVTPSVPVSPGDASESLARLIDGAFESSEPDGVAARRQLRELLDSWWEAEKQEAKAAADDATARAAMRVHTAKIEAGEIARFVPPSNTPQTPTVYRYQPPAALPTPMVAALDETDHEHLDDVLAHLLDELDDGTRTSDLPERADEVAVSLLDSLTAPALPPPPAAAQAVTLPAPTDSLNDRSAEPQEAFERFWNGFGGVAKRRWMFPQLILPAFAVVAVLALVLAVVG